jgi:hypothetical protein
MDSAQDKGSKNWCCFLREARDCQYNLKNHCYQNKFFGSSVRQLEKDIKENCEEVPHYKCSGLK